MKQHFAGAFHGLKPRRGIAVFCAALIGAVTVLPLAACGKNGQNLPSSAAEGENSQSGGSSSYIALESTPVSSVAASSAAASSAVASSVPARSVPVSGSMAAVYQDVAAVNQVKFGDYFFVVFGYLKSDPKQGAALVINTYGNAANQKYLTPEKHGAVKAIVPGETETAVGVASEDGYQWDFNAGEGFSKGCQGKKDASWTSTPTVTGEWGQRIEPPDGKDWIAYLNREKDSIYRKKKNGTQNLPIRKENVLTACLAGGWVYYVADLSTICKVKTDGSQKTKVCGTDSMGDINGSTEVTMEPEGANVLIKKLQLRCVGDMGPLPEPHYYRLDTAKKTIVPVKMNLTAGKTLTPVVSASVKIRTVDTSGFEKITIGENEPQLVFASESRVIFRNSFGLFVYDLKNKKMAHSVDLKGIGCEGLYAQGNYAEIFASKDGGTVYLNPVSGINMSKFFVYRVGDDRMTETKYREVRDRYATGYFLDGKVPDGMSDVNYGLIGPNVYVYLFWGNSRDAHLKELQAIVYREKGHLETCYNVFQ